MSDLPAGTDLRLWIRSEGCVGPDYLSGNGHTFRGRISAWCPHNDRGFSVSLGEIEEMSAEAEIWINGYLAGNEPPGEEMYGEEWFELADDDPRFERWRRAITLFHQTGVWVTDRLPCERCGSEMLPSEPPGTVCSACRDAVASADD
ncbi:MAG: hypothetical protein M3066_08125 [Actinomycetota bacterium]|nr:hypothetical protein [Actinomycetota bacterium]